MLPAFPCSPLRHLTAVHSTSQVLDTCLIFQLLCLHRSLLNINIWVDFSGVSEQTDRLSSPLIVLARMSLVSSPPVCALDVGRGAILLDGSSDANLRHWTSTRPRGEQGLSWGCIPSHALARASTCCPNHGGPGGSCICITSVASASSSELGGPGSPLALMPKGRKALDQTGQTMKT